MDIKWERGGNPAFGILLKPHWNPARKLQSAGIFESPNTAQCTERMIERTVFLHQDYHMLGVHEGAACGRLDAHRLQDGRRKK